MSSSRLESSRTGLKRDIKCQFDRYCERWTDLPSVFTIWIEKGDTFCIKYEDLSKLSTVWSAWDALTIISKREVYGWHLQLFLPSSRLSFVHIILEYHEIPGYRGKRFYDFENCENMGASNFLVILALRCYLPFVRWSLLQRLAGNLNWKIQIVIRERKEYNLLDICHFVLCSTVHVLNSFCKSSYAHCKNCQKQISSFCPLLSTAHNLFETDSLLVSFLFIQIKVEQTNA